MLEFVLMAVMSLCGPAPGPAGQVAVEPVSHGVEVPPSGAALEAGGMLAVIVGAGLAISGITLTALGHVDPAVGIGAMTTPGLATVAGGGVMMASGGRREAAWKGWLARRGHEPPRTGGAAILYGSSVGAVGIAIMGVGGEVIRRSPRYGCPSEGAAGEASAGLRASVDNSCTDLRATGIGVVIVGAAVAIGGGGLLGYGVGERLRYVAWRERQSVRATPVLLPGGGGVVVRGRS